MRALSALCLPDYYCFAWSKVSSADLHVVENTFDCWFESYLRSQFFQSDENYGLALCLPGKVSRFQ